jgi:hypothetical protein
MRPFPAKKVYAAFYCTNSSPDDVFRKKLPLEKLLKRHALGVTSAQFQGNHERIMSARVGEVKFSFNLIEPS